MSSELDGLVADRHRRRLGHRRRDRRARCRRGRREVAVLRPRHVRMPTARRSSRSPSTSSDDASVAPAIAAVGERFGRIDILVNNAGIGAQGDVDANDDDEWHARASTSTSPASCASAARRCRTCAQSPAAAIVQHVVDRGDRRPAAARALQRDARARSLSLTRAMAADHLREGIRVNAVNPGTADTPWVGRLLDAARPIPRPSAPHSRPGSRTAAWCRPTRSPTPSRYLASPRAGSTTGTRSRSTAACRSCGSGPPRT